MLSRNNLRYGTASKHSLRWPHTVSQSLFLILLPRFVFGSICPKVKAVPGSLGFDPSLFRETFEAFTEVFGAEETKGMVTRNPNLLAVRPTGFGGAINAKKDTMQMSYLIAYTR